MQFKYKCLLIIAPLIFFFDQLAKYLISAKIPFGGGISIIPGYFDIVHYTNSGAAFGMLSGIKSTWRVPFFYVVSVAALIAIIIYVVKLPETERLMAAALSLVVGGIFGNGLDRLRLGAVTDFLSVHMGDKVLWGMRLEWPAFNVADSAITIATALLIIGTFKKQK